MSAKLPDPSAAYTGQHRQPQRRPGCEPWTPSTFWIRPAAPTSGGCDQKPRTWSSACAMSPVGYQVGRAKRDQRDDDRDEHDRGQAGDGDPGADVGEATSYRLCSSRSLVVIP